MRTGPTTSVVVAVVAVGDAAFPAGVVGGEVVPLLTEGTVVVSVAERAGGNAAESGPAAVGGVVEDITTPARHALPLSVALTAVVDKAGVARPVDEGVVALTTETAAIEHAVSASLHLALETASFHGTVAGVALAAVVVVLTEGALLHLAQGASEWVGVGAVARTFLTVSSICRAGDAVLDTAVVHALASCWVVALGVVAHAGAVGALTGPAQH